jgi:general nucleoside transport system ATP-binding protein
MTQPTPVSPAVEMDGITRRFAHALANDRVTLRVAAGSVHALVGENGAGKSTLMKILYGELRPDSGTMRVEGSPARFRSPADAIARGIGMVHQHFMLVPPFTVAENVILGDERARWGVLAKRRAEDRVAELSERYHLAVDPRAAVAGLGVGQQQRVEILKVLHRDARIIILDEPTAVLTPGEVGELFATVREMRAAGKTIIIITHKLREVTALSDRVTVLRAGRRVADSATADTTLEQIARLMVGREVLVPALARQLDATATAGGRGEQAPSPAPAHDPIRADATPALRADDISLRVRGGAAMLSGVSLQVLPGEILGIAGVEGNGQTQLAEVLTGLRAPTSGRVEIGGRDVTRLGPRARFAAGMACIPEDRHRNGLILGFTLGENLKLGRHREEGATRRFSRAGACSLLQRFDVRPPDPGAPARRLSGGNQQKLVVAREVTRGAHVLVACQPTRGVDLGAVEFIHRHILELREAGCAVILISAELSEILALSDRVAVMYGGRIVFTAPNTGLAEHDLGIHMAGGSRTGGGNG